MPIVSVRRHLVGDLTLPKGTPRAHRRQFNRLLRCTAAAARDCKQVWEVTSGYRSFDEQADLYDRNMNPETGRPYPGRPLTAKPGTSNHEGGEALDVRTRAGKASVGGSWRRRRALAKYGLCLPVPGEPWHVEFGDTWLGGKRP